MEYTPARNNKTMNFFPLISKLQNFPVAECARELSSVSSLNPEAFVKHQEKKKWAIVEYHLANNKFYKSFAGNRTFSNWADIPILQKSDIQRPLVEVLSSGISLNEVYRNNTSGSTGKPFHFAKDRFCHGMTWAYIMSCYRALDLEYGKSLQARFFGIPLTRQKYLKEKVKDFFSARVRFPVFDLSNRQLEIYLKRFQEHKFEYIYGYTSSLVLFARFVISRNEVLKSTCPTLKWCIVTSEVCSKEDRAVLEKAFGVSVVNEYGAAELDIIAFQDRDGDWLLNEENLFIELVDQNGSPVREGEEGTVLVTSLFNKAMPFVRYNLGDVVSLFPERKGYRRKINTMQGRTNDVAILPSGKKSPGLTFYYISKSLLEQGGFLKEFTIKQKAYDLFHFEYVADAELSETQKKKVEEMMLLYLEPGLKATFERREKIERTSAGKFKHFQSLVSEPTHSNPTH